MAVAERRAARVETHAHASCSSARSRTVHAVTPAACSSRSTSSRVGEWSASMEAMREDWKEEGALSEARRKTCE